MCIRDSGEGRGMERLVDREWVERELGLDATTDEGQQLLDYLCDQLGVRAEADLNRLNKGQIQRAKDQLRPIPAGKFQEAVQRVVQWSDDAPDHPPPKKRPKLSASCGEADDERPARKGWDHDTLGHAIPRMLEREFYIHRKDKLDQLVQLLSTEEAEHAHAQSPVAVTGYPGTGKTELCKALLHEKELQEAFPGGFGRCVVTKSASGEKVIRRVLTELVRNARDECAQDLMEKPQWDQQECEAACEHIMRLCQERKVLVVLDDVWAREQAEAVVDCVRDSPSRVLMTSRRRDLVEDELGVVAKNLIVFTGITEGEALRLLHSRSTSGATQTKSMTAYMKEAEAELSRPPRRRSFRHPMNQLAKKCGYVPLALNAVGSTVKRRLRSGQAPNKAWACVCQMMTTETQKDLMKAVDEAVAMSVDTLDPRLRDIYLSFAAVPEKAIKRIPVGVLERMWNTDESGAFELCGNLAGMSLLTTENGNITLHDLQYDVVCRWKPRQQELVQYHDNLLRSLVAQPLRRQNALGINSQLFSDPFWSQDPSWSHPYFQSLGQSYLKWCTRHHLQGASEELRNDQGVVLAAVVWDGRALRFASEVLRNDKDVVLAAVRENGHALEFVSEELRNDKEVVLDAVMVIGSALKVAAEELRNDKDVVLAASPE
eukprot:TRINITY_DN9827_c0_g1_i2.p1 TRINITY_DN9827_c0_g1~~TRINITY_DN9827_c0_g1_i2.p1  ORF type:complete len:658 (+),score=155.70 TRINITY_DN9827_c0_g1_i2:188-2161(+)